MAEFNLRFEKYQSYVESQMRRIKKGGPHPPALIPTITFSRETGAGANTLGDKLSDHLNVQLGDAGDPWTVFDKNLVKQVLEDHGLPERLEQHMPEDKPRPVEDALGDMLGMHPPSWELVKHTHATIYRLAKMGHCILIGRGASVITQDLPNVFRFRLVGSLEKRVVRCMDYYGITERDAQERIKKQDRARKRYVLAYYDKEIDDPTNYHLVINVDMFSTEALVRLITDLVMNQTQ